MNKKFHITFDMDDTLASLAPTVIDLARVKLGLKLKFPTHGKYRGWFPGQLTDEQRAELLALVYTPEFYGSLPSMFRTMHDTSLEHVSEVAYALYHTVSITTARSNVLATDEVALRVTREWLIANRFKNAEHVTINCHAHTRPKSAYFEGPTVIVDDAIEVADDVLRFDQHRVIMPDRPWNTQYRGGGRHFRRTQCRHLCEAMALMAES